MHFGAQVREKRKSLRMTETECAARAGMKLQQWNRMEKTVERPAHKTVSSVAVGLMLEVEEVQHMAGQAASGSQERHARVIRHVERSLYQVPEDRLDDWAAIAVSAANALAKA